MPYIEGEDRNQMILFPECIDDYIDEDNVVRVIDVYVEQLDVATLGFKFAVSPGRGRPPFRPQILIKLYMYGYLNGIRSSRRLEHETKRNLELMWLLGKLSPDHKTIANFRKDHKKLLKQLFQDFNILCRSWGLFGKELVAFDGSKFKASNSKRNNFSKKKLDRHLKYIDEKIEQYLKELDENDERESMDRKPTAKEINERIKELRERKHTYETYQKELEETGKNELSTTDPDARLMASNNNGLDVSYNVQASVDDKHKMVADFEVTNSPNDQGQLSEMAVRTKEFFEVTALDALADKGYYEVEDLKVCVENGITPIVSKQTYSNGTGDQDFYPGKFRYDKDRDVYICPAGHALSYGRTRKTKEKEIQGYDYNNFQACQACAYKERCTKSKKGRSIFRHVDQDFLDTIDAHTKARKDTYSLRALIVEHPFGTIKRNWNAYYFLTRGQCSVSAEMALSFLAYNFKRAIKVLGVKEILRRLREKGEPAPV